MRGHGRTAADERGEYGERRQSGFHQRRFHSTLRRMTRSILAIIFVTLVAGLAGPATAQSPPSRPAAASAKASADKPASQATPAPRLADGHPDFNGYWKGMRDTVPTGNIAKDLPGLKLPLTPAGEAAWKYNTTATIDPESLCIPGGIPRHNASGLPFVILQSSKQVAFLYFYTYYRLIPVDAARRHTDDPDPSFFGEELGQWQGDTLVVDSTGFKDTQVWADENGSPHSDALHVVERWTRPDHDHIHVDTLIEDPKFYTRSFHYARTWELGRPDEELAEYACSENNIDRDHLQ